MTSDLNFIEVLFTCQYPAPNLIMLFHCPIIEPNFEMSRSISVFTTLLGQTHVDCVSMTGLFFHQSDLREVSQNIPFSFSVPLVILSFSSVKQLLSFFILEVNPNHSAGPPLFMRLFTHQGSSDPNNTLKHFL